MRARYLPGGNTAALIQLDGPHRPARRRAARLWRQVRRITRAAVAWLLGDRP